MESEKLLQRLVGNYKCEGSGSLINLMTAIGNSLGSGRAAVVEVQASHYIDTASGFGLDLIGQSLKAPRFGYENAWSIGYSFISSSYSYIHGIVPPAIVDGVAMIATTDQYHYVASSYVGSLNLVA